MTALCCESRHHTGAEHPTETRSRASLSAMRRAWQLVQTWRERARSRRELALIEPWVSRDLALSRSDVRYEIEKPFWRG